MSALEISAAISLDNSALIEYSIPERSCSASPRPVPPRLNKNVSVSQPRLSATTGGGGPSAERTSAGLVREQELFWSNAATVQVLFIFILQLRFPKLSCSYTLGSQETLPLLTWHQLTGQPELRQEAGIHLYSSLAAQLPTSPWGPLLPRGPGAPRVPAFLMSERRSGLSGGPENFRTAGTDEKNPEQKTKKNKNQPDSITCEQSPSGSGCSASVSPRCSALALDLDEA